MTDRYGSTADINNYPAGPGDALLYDKDLKAKAAYSAVQDVLRR